MKLYYHPVSTTSRSIMMFAADSGIALEYQLVDLFKGEHLQPAFTAINPNQLVPVLEDGDFRLTESSAILKYLAEKTGSPAYPRDLRQRARVNERMDWFNTSLSRDLMYGFVYPQSLPHHKRQDDATQANTLAWGRKNARRWLGILDEQLIGPNNAYVCGDAITLADYMGAAMLSHWRGRARRLLALAQRQPLAGHHEGAPELGQGAGAVPDLLGQAVRRAGVRGAVRQTMTVRDQGPAPQRLPLQRFRAHARASTRTSSACRWPRRSRSAKPRPGARPRRCTASTGSATARSWRSSKCPACRSTGRQQHDYDLHIALEVDHAVLETMMAKGRSASAWRCAACPTTGSSIRSTSATRTAT